MQQPHSPLSIVFFGTPAFAAEGLTALLNNPQFVVRAVITQPDRPAGRGAQLQISAVKACALQHGIPVLQPQSVRKELSTFLKELQAFGPIDIGVVIAFGQILPVEVLEYPRAGSVNVHASLLPRWRGAAPIQRALLAGDKETGLCLMKMEAGLDTGPVYVSEAVTILDSDNFETLHNRLSQCSAELLNKYLFKIATGAISAHPQSENGVTHAQKISNEEAQIHWNSPALEIERKIRGLSPIPGAFSRYKGKRFKIFAAQISLVQSSSNDHQPGQIIALDRGLLRIACGQGSLELLSMQLEGKKRLEVGEFLKGTPLILGESLGT